jgi:hypothetical protein
MLQSSYHVYCVLVNDQLDAQFFFYMFISVLYMFWATSCSSSGESVVSIQHLVCVTLCRCPSSMQVGKELLPDLHTRRSPTQSDTYQMLYWYNWFYWWWARGCSKHVENWNKHILPDLHNRRSPTQSDTYRMLYWYNWFSCCWARGCSKHVENWNKPIEKELCVKLVIYKNYTKIHGQQNIKYVLHLCVLSQCGEAAMDL